MKIIKFEKKIEKVKEPETPKSYRINWNNVTYSENLNSGTRVHFGPNHYVDIIKPLNEISYPSPK